MTPDDVHPYEMPKLPDDQWPADDPALAAFAEDLRIVAAGPAPEPRPGLVAVMRQGAVPVEPPIAGRNKKMLLKTLVGGLVAKVAMGVGVATASVTAAGAAGVLPDAAQQAVASVVAAATPFSLPDTSDVTTLATEDEPGGTTTTTTGATTTTLAGTDDEEGTGGESPRAVNHGACVSTAAKDNSGDGNHGKTVSSVARSDCGKTEASPSTTTTVPGSTTTTVASTTTTVDDGLRSSNSGPAISGNSNRGNSGNGGANSGDGGRGRSGRN